MTDRARSGVVPVDKPVGPTSHDLVARVRRALGEKRVGHTGTLDPFASGLLLLCVGPATRLAQYLTGLAKTYVATLRLGSATDTDDATGETIATSDLWILLDPARIRARFQSRVGTFDQVPPIYSARKIAGVRSYRAARSGRAIPLPATSVTVHSLTVTRIALPYIDFEITCSSGTYIRALARDIGVELRCHAHLTALRRTRVGEFAVEDAVPPGLTDDPAALEAAWISALDAVGHLPRIDVSSEEAEALSHGRSVSWPGPQGGPDVVVAAGGRLVAIAAAAGGRLHPRRVFPG